MTKALHEHTISEIGKMFRSRKLSVPELVRHFSDRIDRHDSTIRAFSSVMFDRAMAQADAAQSEVDRGIDLGPMHGIPIALKDNIDVGGQPTRCNSHLAAARVPSRNAILVDRLRTAGAIELGKTTLHEFAFGGPAWDTPDPPARNPWDPSRFTGGSSSGSAAAIAGGLVPAAIGTDTVGSIRLPAAKCGVVGFKPTFDRVPTIGTVPLSYSLDHCGPMAGCVEDCRHLFNALIGSTKPGPAPATALPSGLRVGYVRHFYETDAKVDDDVANLMHASIGFWAHLGFEVVEVDLSSLKLYAACCMTIMLSEALAIHETDLVNRPDAFGEIVRDRLALASQFSAADYVQALRLKQKLTKEMLAAFAQVDVLVTASFPTEAPPLSNVDKYYILQNPLLTTPFNVTGVPAVCLPVGRSSNGLPLGIQMAAAPGRDLWLLAVAELFEMETGFPEKRHRMCLPLTSNAGAAPTQSQLSDL